MLQRYLLTLLLVIAAVTALCSALPLATRSHVRAGAAVAEKWSVEFTLGAGGNEYYIVDDAVKAALESGITFTATGPVRIVSSAVRIEPETVSWKDGDTRHTAPGAKLRADIKWEATSDSPDGATGDIHINPLPKLPGISSNSVIYHSGTEQVREITVYQSAMRMTLGQLSLAFRVALPLAFLLHSIWWAAFVLRKESKVRRAALAPADPDTLPRTFYPSPLAEWNSWMITLFIFAGVGSLIASFAIFDGVVKNGMDLFIAGTVGVGLVIGLFVVAIVRSSVTTVHVDPGSISIARGRGTPAWQTAQWAQLQNVVEQTKTYKGNVTRWVVVTYPDGKKRRISQAIIDYPQMKDMVFQQYTQNKSS